MRAALGLVGYTEADLRHVQERAGGELSRPEDLRRVIDSYQYLDDWRANYCIQSVRSSLHNSRITCIDAAILSYGLLDIVVHVLLYKMDNNFSISLRFKFMTFCDQLFF